MARGADRGDPARVRRAPRPAAPPPPSTGSGASPLGEPSVVVAVSAPHREEAFAGAREAIDRIKAEAPIWKREATRRERASGSQGAGRPGAGGRRSAR